MSHYVKTFQRSVLVLLAVVLVVPVFAHAAEFAVFPVAPKGKVTLTVSVGGVTAKAGSVTIPPNTEVALNWTVPSGWKGCWSSWDSLPLLTSGTITGTLPAEAKGRSFVLTCVGVGQAQTASVQVTVSKPNLTTATPTLAQGTLVSGKYLLEPSPFILKYKVTNSTKVAVASLIRVNLEKRKDTGASEEIDNQLLAGLPASGSKEFTFNDTLRTEASNDRGDQYSYRVCVDVEKKVDESSETDNCSPFTKHFIFGNIKK